MEKILSVQNLSASLDDSAILKNLSLEVNAGELHLILGMNGSGKSTFGKVLLDHPRYQKTDGSIFFLGENIDELETHERAKKGIFLSHQSPPAVDGVSAKDLLRAADKQREKRRSIIAFKKELKQNLNLVNLSPRFMERGMNEGASGGERKKMEIASLMTLGARLAFLDEIDSGLDVDALKTVSNGINTFLESKENAVILVSHSSGILKYLKPTHVHVFCGGHILASGGMELAEEVHEKGYTPFLDCIDCAVH